MKVRASILTKINNPQARTRIAVVLGIGEQSVAIHMRKNPPNGRLTKMDALQAIAKEAECDVAEILEQEAIAG